MESKALEKAIDDIKLLTQQIHFMKEQVAESKKRLDSIEPSAVEKYMKSAKADAKEVHDKYRILILKQVVATEVCFLAKINYPELAYVLSRTVVRAYDEMDEWWTEKDNYTLDQWVECLIDLSTKYTKRDTESRPMDIAAIGTAVSQ